MYKDNILELIKKSPLQIDTEIKITGRPPTMANSEFLTNKEQGDWAEQIVFKAINEFSKDFLLFTMVDLIQYQQATMGLQNFIVNIKVNLII